MPLMRLDKFLSELGVASRKELRQIIKSGRVLVNGAAVNAPEYKLDPERDTVVLDGETLSYVKFRYFMLDKPSGVLSTTEDRRQKTVLDLLPPELQALELFPVGRLDKDTTGLLLLTNDGELAFKSGASATITGNMLTTVACATIRSDKEMLEGMGRNVTPEYMK